MALAKLFGLVLKPRSIGSKNDLTAMNRSQKSDEQAAFETGEVPRLSRITFRVTPILFQHRRIQSKIGGRRNLNARQLK